MFFFSNYSYCVLLYCVVIYIVLCNLQRDDETTGHDRASISYTKAMRIISNYHLCYNCDVRPSRVHLTYRLDYDEYAKS